MPSSFECRACKAKVEVPEKLIGNRLKCERCQTLLTIPGTAATEIPKPKPAQVHQPKDDEDEDDDDDSLIGQVPVRQDGSGLVLRIVLIGFGGLMLIATCLGGGLYFLLNRSPNQIAVNSKPAASVVVRPFPQIAKPVVPQPFPVPVPKPFPTPKPDSGSAQTPAPKPNWIAFTEAAGVQFGSPCTVVKDGFGAINGSNWVGKYGKQHGINPWMTDQFYFSVSPLRAPFAGRPTEEDFLKLLEGHREYARHKSGELITKRMTALDGKICLEIRFRQKGISVKEEIREHNSFFIATDGKRLAIFDFKTFGAPPEEEVVKGVIESFRFLQ